MPDDAKKITDPDWDTWPENPPATPDVTVDQNAITELRAQRAAAIVREEKKRVKELEEKQKVEEKQKAEKQKAEEKRTAEAKTKAEETIEIQD